MNTDWLDGKHPAIREALDESAQPNEKNRANNQLTAPHSSTWLGWGLYWFVVLLLTWKVGEGSFMLGLFVALIKWFSTGRKKDLQNQTDRLHHKMGKGSSFPISDDDTIFNPIHNIYLGNISHKRDD